VTIISGNERKSRKVNIKNNPTYYDRLYLDLPLCMFCLSTKAYTRKVFFCTYFGYFKKVLGEMEKVLAFL